MTPDADGVFIEKQICSPRIAFYLYAENVTEPINKAKVCDYSCEMHLHIYFSIILLFVCLWIAISSGQKIVEWDSFLTGDAHV